MKDYDELFKITFQRRMLSRAVADIIIQCIKEFTPEQLGRAIEDNWSLVGFLASLPEEKAMVFFQSIPSVSAVMLGLQKHPKTIRPLLNHLDSIPLDEMGTRIARKLPEHARILSSHPEWIKGEMARAKTLV